MAAHRYWRAVAIETYGSGDLELGCFHLLDAAGVRVDAPATLTASTAPTVGLLASLQDDDLSTAARWASQSIAALSLTWDFGGSSVDVADISLAGNSETRFALSVKIQYSDNASVWVDWVTAAGIRWPGVNAKTASGAAVTLAMLAPSGYYKFEDSAGTVLIDSSGYSRHGSYVGGGLPTAPGLLARGGEKALRTAAAQYHTIPNAAFPGAGDFTLAFKIQFTTPANTVILERGGNSLSLQIFDGGQASYAVPVGSLGIVAGAGSPAVVVGTSIVLNDGVPHDVVIGYSSAGTAGCFVVVDGVDRTVRGSHRSPTVDGSAWQVGSRSGVAGYGGALDELAFFSRLLSLSEAVKLTEPFNFPIQKNTVRGRVASSDLITIGTGPAIIYGLTQLVSPTWLTVQSGSVRDYASGVLGTGKGRVAGTVKEKGTPNVPVYRKVRLIRERDGLQMRELWSHPVTGVYSFDYVDELQLFTVLSYDHTGAFRAVVASGIAPELIP